MGFDRTAKEYQCGCYSDFYTHDSFFYTDPSRGVFHNLCGKHEYEKAAAQDDRYKETDMTVRILKEAEDILLDKIKPVPMIKYLREENRLSEDETDRLYNYDSKLELIKELLQLFIKDSNKTLFVFRMALIKTGQAKLLKYVNKPVESDIAISTSDEERCTCMYIYKGIVMLSLTILKILPLSIFTIMKTLDLKNYPTIQGVSLTISRWLQLQSNEKQIDGLFRKAIDDELFQEKRIHLGCGLYDTPIPKYPTVDIRHFWKPSDSNKAVPTKRGVALNKTKWNALRSVMVIMTDFVPELTSGIVGETTHDNEKGMLECTECNPFPVNKEEREVESDETSSLPENQEGVHEIALAIL